MRLSGKLGELLLELFEMLGEVAVFVSASGGGTLSGSVVSWPVGALAAGASGSVQMVVRVASPLTNGTVTSSRLG